MSTTLKRHQMFIGGKWADSSGGDDQEIINPATGKVIAHVPKGTAEDVDRAVAAAKKAYDEVWFDTTPRERSEMLLKLADAILEHGEELASMESENVGKPLAPRRCPRRSRRPRTASGSSPAPRASSRASRPAST